MNTCSDIVHQKLYRPYKRIFFIYVFIHLFINQCIHQTISDFMIICAKKGYSAGKGKENMAALRDHVVLQNT